MFSRSHELNQNVLCSVVVFGNPDRLSEAAQALLLDNQLHKSLAALQVDGILGRWLKARIALEV